MIVFDKTNIALINDVWSFLSDCGDVYLVDDAFNIESKKELAGWLLYESEGHGDRYFKELDIFEKAFYVSKGVVKYGE
jgi:hypothetical protein